MSLPPDTKRVTKRWHVVPTDDETPARAKAAAELEARLRKEVADFDSWAWYAADGAVLRRFLTARDGDVPKAAALLKQALAWRRKRKPHVVDYAEVEKESRTGKLRVAPALDRWGRPVVVFDNSVQNTKDPAAQLRCLAFVLEHALRRVDGTAASKYVIFMHLNDFSLLNNPPWSVTKETMEMLMCCFAECCGHIVLHNAPSVFSMVFSMCKPFIDPKTGTKIVFVKDGDDAACRDIIGDDWRALTGAGLPRAAPKSSPGYVHEANWAATVANDRAWRARTGNRGPLRHEVKNLAADAAAPSPVELSRGGAAAESRGAPTAVELSRGAPTAAVELSRGAPTAAVELSRTGPAPVELSRLDSGLAAAESAPRRRSSSFASPFLPLAVLERVVVLALACIVGWLATLPRADLAAARAAAS